MVEIPYTTCWSYSICHPSMDKSQTEQMQLGACRFHAWLTAAPISHSIQSQRWNHDRFRGSSIANGPMKKQSDLCLLSLKSCRLQRNASYSPPKTDKISEDGWEGTERRRPKGNNAFRTKYYTLGQPNMTDHWPQQATNSTTAFMYNWRLSECHWLPMTEYNYP